MKARHGFVSNSSSSSFILFASAEVIEEALSKCSELQQEIAKKFLHGPEDFLGRKVMSYAYCNGNNGDWYYDEVSDAVEKYIEKYPDAVIDHDEASYFAFNEFENKVMVIAERLKENVLKHTEDM